jgi:hypothetical protein
LAWIFAAMSNHQATKTLECILMALIIYTVAASTRYRLKHPELTETQLLLRTPRWITWR